MKSSSYLTILRRCLIFYGVPYFKRLKYYVLGLCYTKKYGNLLTNYLNKSLTHRGLTYDIPKHLIWIAACNYYASTKSGRPCDKYLGKTLSTESRRLLNTEIYQVAQMLNWWSQ